MLNFDDALEALRGTAATKEALLDLIKQVSIHAEGAITVLYSGELASGMHSTDVVNGMLANGENIRVIDKSPAGRLIASRDFQAKLAAIDGVKLDDFISPDYSSPTKTWLYHGTDGPWAEASGRFIDATEGEVRTLTGNARDDGVFTKTEVPRALENSKITYIDGIQRTDLKTYALDEAIKAIKAQSEVNAAEIKVAVDADGKPIVLEDGARVDSRNFFRDVPDYAGRAPVIETDMRNVAEFIPAERIAQHQAGAEVLKDIQSGHQQIVDLPAGEGSPAARAAAAKALNRLGIAGDIIGLGIATAEANEAYEDGDMARGDRIIGDYAADFVGGLAGGLAAAKMVGMAMARVALMAPPAGAIIAGGVTLLAGLAGALWGGGYLKDTGLGKYLGNLLGTTREKFSKAARTISPIVLDLNGDGVRTTHVSQGVNFDHDRNGFAELSGWVSPEDGLLVRDLNNNGTIDSGRELFGNLTTYANGSSAPNGFSVLAELDGNLDGKIDAADSAFGTLKIWRDSNGDGNTDVGELHALGDVGVSSISTAYVESGVVDAQGNAHRQIGSYTTAGGETRAAIDVWFQTNNTYAFATESVVVADEIAAMPNLTGYGTVHDLHQAMARDSTGTLKGLVEQFAAQTTQAGREAVFEQLFLQWTGAASYSADSRGAYMADGRQLYAIEALLGEKFVQWAGINQGTPNPGPDSAVMLQEVYRDLYEGSFGRLMVQTHLKALYNQVGYVFDQTTRSFRGDLSSVASTLAEMIQSNRSAGLAMVDDFSRALKGMGALGLMQLDSFVDTLSALGADVATVLDANLSGHIGTAGADQLVGSTGTDILIGRKGNDRLTGGQGNDVYLVNLGDGHDRIFEYEFEGGMDVLRFGAGILPSQVTVEIQMVEGLGGLDSTHPELVIKYGGSADSVGLGDYDRFWRQGQGSIERIEFTANGTVWDAATLLSMLTIPDASLGADVIYGTHAADSISGMAGHDFISGETGNDTLNGGLGNDQLHGGDGDDVYLFAKGDGQDWIVESDSVTSGMDTIRFAADVQQGDVIVTRDLNHLYLSIPATADKITIQNFWLGSNGTRIERVEFTDGSGVVWNAALLAAKAAQATAGADFLVGTAGADVLLGSGGNDTIYGQGGADLIEGGLGDDTLRGGASGDVYLFNPGDGRDVVVDAGGIDELRFGAGILPGDVRVSRDAFDLSFFLDATGDQITIKDYFVDNANKIEKVSFANLTIWSETDWLAKTLIPTGFDDYLNGSDAADSISGAAGNDELFGNAGNDTLDGGMGNDVLSGGRGDDTFIFGRGYGRDIAYDLDSTPGNIDRVRMAADILVSDIEVHQEGANLVLSITGTTDKLTLQDWLRQDANRIEEVVFEDGTIWDVSILKAKGIAGTAAHDQLQGFQTDDLIHGHGGNDTLHGLDGNDSLYGDAGADMLYGGGGADDLDGGSGNDTLDGGAGNDTYHFGWGDGIDHVKPTTGRDSVLLKAGVAPADVWFERSAFDLVLQRRYVSGIPEDLLILEGFFNDDTEQRFDAIRFADDPATVWDVAYIKAQALLGNDSSNTILGYAGADVLDGRGGNDYLDGYGGDDQIFGGQGDDILKGGDGGDMFWGGAGADSLDGGAHNDTLDGGTGNDTLSGGAGDDVYLFGRGQGHDVIVNAGELASEVDALQLADGILPEAVALYRHGDDLVVVIDGSSTQVWVRNAFEASGKQQIDQIRFANGTVWTAGEMAARTLSGTGNHMVGTAGNDIFAVDHLSDTISEAAGAGVDTVQSWVNYTLGANIENLTLTGALNINGKGNALNNVIRGNSGNNVLDGGGGAGSTANDGADTLIGGAGDDTYYVTPAEGDTVIELANEGNDTVVANFGYVLPAHVENLIINSSSNSPLTAVGNALDNVITGRSNAVAYVDANGFFVGDTIDGGAGADVMTLTHGGTFYVDNVNDRIQTSGNHRVFSSVDYALPVFVGDVPPAVSDLTLLADAGNLRGTGNAANNKITGNNGDNMLDGGAGDDQLTGYTGNDTLIGGLGNDTYFTHDTWGGQSLIDNAASDGATAMDILEVASGAVVLQRRADDLLISVGSGDTAIMVKNHFAADGLSAIDQIRFTPSGMVWNAQQILENTTTLPESTNGSDTLTGSWASDVLHGQEGHDTIFAGKGADLVFGDEGNDDLHGENGDDVLDGGVGADRLDGGLGKDTLMASQGNDYLNGGWGNDTYLFNRGDGSDIIFDYEEAPNLDTLRFGATISAADVIVTRDWNSVFLTLAGSADQLMLASWRDDDASKIERIEFANGDVWNAVDLLARMSIQEATAGDDWLLFGSDGDDVINGLDGSDNLIGAAGNDTLIGGNGDDTYEFRLGDGHDQIDNAASDHATTGDGVYFGEGISPASVTLNAVGDDLVIRVSPTDSVTIRGYFAAGGTQKIDWIAFSDGTNWDQVQLEAQVGAGNDVLTGTAGNDTLHGFAGNDTISGGDGNDALYGDAGNDILNGDAGDDLLDGGSGADQLRGGTGNDLYVVDNAGDVVTENSNAGTDTIHSTISLTLGNNVENLTLVGNAAINGTGNSLDNILVGNAAANVLNGGAGNDTYYVGLGDTVTESSSAGTDTVMADITWTLGSNLENLTLIGSAAINGTGNTLNNTLVGNSAANVLNGGAGADTMRGGVGDDSYTVDNVGDVVIENANEGVDLVNASVSYTLSANVEKLTLTGSATINATGNALDNVLTGNSGANTLTGGAGNDTLNGGTGADKLIGGTGDDIYFVDNTSDVVTENANEGFDLVNSTITLTLAANVEALILTGSSALNGTGNTLNNLLRGNTGNNTLNGGTGNDILEGGAGNDTLTDTSGVALLNGGSGTDVLTGGAAAELFIGGTGNDTFTTGAGNDLIAFNKNDGQDTFAAGGTGSDTLSLGGGLSYADLSFAKSSNDLVLKLGGSDQITFKNWYATTPSKPLVTLQMVAEAMAGFDAAGADPMLDNKIETFNFAGLVADFDAARAANPMLTQWNLLNTLTTRHLSGSDGAAIGGDLAYQYGKTGSLSEIGAVSAQGILSSPGFGSSAQALQPAANLQNGVRLI